MVNFSVVYFNDMIKPNKVYRLPNDKEKKALQELALGLEKSLTAEEIQKLVFFYRKKQIILIT